MVTFTQQFRYLGAISSSTLSDDDEIAQRLRSAMAAYLAVCGSGLSAKAAGSAVAVGSSSLSLVSKDKVYGTLVLNLLLYG
jgi:polyribonucleotide nucleotidyltransferase